MQGRLLSRLCQDQIEERLVALRPVHGLVCFRVRVQVQSRCALMAFFLAGLEGDVTLMPRWLQFYCDSRLAFWKASGMLCELRVAPFWRFLSHELGSRANLWLLLPWTLVIMLQLVNFSAIERNLA